MKTIETPHINLHNTDEELIKSFRIYIDAMLSGVTYNDKDHLSDTLCNLILNAYKVGLNTGVDITIEASEGLLVRGKQS